MELFTHSFNLDKLASISYQNKLSIPYSISFMENKVGIHSPQGPSTEITELNRDRCRRFKKLKSVAIQNEEKFEKLRSKKQTSLPDPTEGNTCDNTRVYRSLRELNVKDISKSIVFLKELPSPRQAQKVLPLTVLQKEAAQKEFGLKYQPVVLKSMQCIIS